MSLICYVFAIHFKLCFHCCFVCDKMNKTISHLYMFAPRNQQFFSRRMYNSNQISSVHFLLDLFPSFDWTPAQELVTTKRNPIGIPFFFSPLDSPSPPLPRRFVPNERPPLPSSPLSSSISSHQ
jgi:hypothetical protein